MVSQRALRLRMGRDGGRAALKSRWKGGRAWEWRMQLTQHDVAAQGHDATGEVEMLLTHGESGAGPNGPSPQSWVGLGALL